MTELEMIHRLQQRDTVALEAMIRGYNPYVSAIITLVLGHYAKKQDVEELVSDVFYSIWTHSDSLKPGKVKAYIGTTARNKAKSFLRKHREIPMDTDEIIIPTKETPEQLCLNQECSRLIREAIHNMTEPDREIFIRYYYYLQSTSEIGRYLNMKPGTVRIHLMRGRNALKKILEKEDVLWV